MQTKLIVRAKLLAVLLLLSGAAHAASTQLADSPLSGATSTETKPNILFVLDDSGSMDWDYMPDWAGLATQISQSRNHAFNGVSYDPAISYVPPKYINGDGTPNTTTYPSRTSVITSGWTAVKDDGYGVQSTTSSTLIGSGFYFTTIAGEYCTDKALKDCVVSDAPAGAYDKPAPLRWCKTAADAAAASPAAGACQATEIEASGVNTPFTFPRMPSPRTSVITIAGSGSVSSIKVDGKEILSAAAAGASSAALATAVSDSINACSFAVTGPVFCQVVGYRAAADGGMLTIFSPIANAPTPIIASTPALVAPAFLRPSDNLAPGENLLTVITASTPSYVKSGPRADCVGAGVCTYAEEMTNFANWWSYYRTRMQSMKTASSRAFDPIIDKYRIGYASINNNTGSDFQNISDFDAAQKKAWYDKLFAAIPKPTANTPLRIALSNAGRLYSGKLTTLNSVAVVDPVQYFCQQNVTLLSTDGYWNEGAGFKIDGTTAVGDQDGPGLEVRPQLDGGGPKGQQGTVQKLKLLTPTQPTWLRHKTVEQRQSGTPAFESRTTEIETQTSTLQSQTGQWQTRTYKLQSRSNTISQVSTLTRRQEQTKELQKRSGPLQKQTAHLQTQTKTVSQTRTSQLQSQSGTRQRLTYQLQQRLTQVQKRTSSNSGTTYGGWVSVDSCSPVISGINRVQCRTLAQSSWTDASSCSYADGATIISNPGQDTEYTTYYTQSLCQYAGPAWVDGACTGATIVPRSAGPIYTVGTAVEACQTVWSGTWSDVSSCNTSDTLQCQYANWTGWSDVGSCTPADEVAQSTGPNYTVGVARACQTDWTAWSDTGSTCTASDTVGCQYGAWSAPPVNDASCSPVDKSTANPWSVIVAVQCPINYGDWLGGQILCTEVTAGGTRTQCQYATDWSAWNDVGSCTETPVSTGPAYTGPARNCRWTWTDAVNGACPGESPTVHCTTTWSTWADVPSGGCPAGAECQYREDEYWHNTPSCVEDPFSNGHNTATLCNMTWPNPWVNAVGSCTPADNMQCQYTDWTGWLPAASCGPGDVVARSTASPYSVLIARNCQTDWTLWSATTGPCPPNTPDYQCQQSDPTWIDVPSCSESPTCRWASLSDELVEPTDSAYSDALTDTIATSSPITGGCEDGTTASGRRTTCEYVVPNPSLLTPTPSCVPGAASSTNNYVERTCTTSTTGPIDLAPGVTCNPAAASNLNSYTTTICPFVGSGPTPDTLADVAEYYWKTDLRDPGLGNCTGGPVVTGNITSTNNVCSNEGIVPPLPPRQVMNTYTLGLGASGWMQYDKNYKTATSGDFYSIAVETPAETGACPWQTNGPCNWPKPQSNEQTNIDDLWHAAVNGRGSYFSAGDPSSMAAGISSALHDVEIKEGGLAAITVTNPNLTAGDNSFFETSFTAGSWTGELTKRTINGTDGSISPIAAWTAKSLLDAKVLAGTHTARTIFTYDFGGESAPGNSDNLKFFLWDNLTAAEREYFRKPHIASLSQLCSTGTICLSATNQNLAADDTLVNFLRGDRTKEGVLFRQRAHLLGDIVGSEAVYVSKSPWNYADYQYSAFKASNNGRAGMVYIAANDGMLHAFNATDGQESWAYVPRIVLPKLYQLADVNYGNLHTFLVDGSPVMGDICAEHCVTGDTDTKWKTILVGGLNKGGRGYYALDITDPAAPKALWEFTNDNLGYSYGNPIISKLEDGTWVVIFASGYNNVSPGDGQGRLFVVNANTGEELIPSRSIATGAGNAATPSGLARISAWANFPDNNNTARRVYGGDLLGNLWRFDINGDIPAGEDPPVFDAQRLATLKDAAGLTQPITTRPELGLIKNNPVVFVGTGQLLGTSDLLTSQTQSVYAIKDRLSATDYGSPRPLSPAQTDPTPGSFVAQTMTFDANSDGTVDTCPAGNPFCVAGQAIVSVSKNPVNFATNDGWYVDFPVGGQRVNTDIRLVQGTLAFTTNTPQSVACVPVGVSYSFFLDYQTGGYVAGTDGIAGFKYGDYLSSSPALIRLEDGSIRELTKCDGSNCVNEPKVPIDPGSLPTRRISWRELITE